MVCVDRVLSFEQPTGRTDSPRSDQGASAIPPEAPKPLAGATSQGGANSDALVARAAAGDGRAWDLLVERHVGLLWAIARGLGLPPAAAAADVVQVGWLRLVEHLGDIRGGEPVDVWLAKMTRQECLRRLRSVPEPGWGQRLDGAAQADARDGWVEASRPGVDGAEVSRALHRLPPRQRLLLHVLGSAPTPTPAAVSAAVDLPIERIEATRVEALHRLRKLLDRSGAPPW